MGIVEQELEVLEFWKKDKTFEKSLLGKKKKYTFYDGPPFATGLPHYGHLLACFLKDSIPRFWTMRGYRVDRVWGWDCHGLPIENIAERELGIKDKKQIEEMGVDKFCDFCRKMVLKYAHEWKKTVERIGRWTEFDNSYKTMDNTFMESVWWSFKQIWDKGLMYEGRKILLYCPHCQTPLANAEIAMDNSYKEVTEETVTAKFKVKGKNEYLLAWTTTPWTLIGNAALAVNSEEDYVRVKKGDEIYILAKERASEVEGKIVEKFKGSKLKGLEYEPLYKIESDKKGHYVLAEKEGVTVTDGTGIVHMAAYGEFDYEMIKKYDLPLIVHIGENGTLVLGPEKWKGLWFKKLNKEVLNDLKERNLVYEIKNHSHSYPFCYRCSTPLFYSPLRSWFINIQKIKKNLLANNKKIAWYPEHLKDGRVKHNFETAPDWNISRNRYWASVIPIWKCDCGEMKVIGSIEELKKYAIKLPKNLDLHKDVMDKVFLKCDCGKEMKRVPEVLDCWFESGSMPFAQFHYPFENKDYFKGHFPADFVTEYIAQTRAWFYYTIVVSELMFGKQPFENVVTTGNILGEDGEKMSKSKGNFPDPNILLNKYGADALRFYLLGSPVVNAEDIRFSEKSVEEVYKRVLLLLHNVGNFYVMNNPDKKGLGKKKSEYVLDKWIESRLNGTIKKIGNYLEQYNTVDAAKEINKYVEDLSVWYVRRSRERFNGEDAETARSVLGNVLAESTKMMAPLLPFISESIYRNVTLDKKSVHLEDWPSFSEKKIDDKLEKNMDKVREIVSIALRERDLKGVPVRQVLASLEIHGAELEDDFAELIRDEVNVKKVIFKKGKDLTVKLDMVITPELEAEGIMRELSRRVQSERKTRGLMKQDSINLEIYAEGKYLEYLKATKDMLADRTGSKKVIFTDNKKSNFIDFKVKESTISFLF